MTDQANTSATKVKDLRTPPEWAEHYGITGLVESEWEIRHVISRYGEPREFGPPEWDDPMHSVRFLRILHNTNYATRRTKKMPKYAPTAEAVRDVLADHRGWVDTTMVTALLSEPLGYLRNHALPPNTKALNILKALASDGFVVCHEDVDSRDIPDALTGYGTSGKKWMLTETYEALVVDRELDRELGRTREAAMSSFLDGIGMRDSLGDYRHLHDRGTKSVYVDGEYRFGRDRSKVTLDWIAFEAIVRLIEEGS